MKPDRAGDVKVEAERILNFLAGLPCGIASAERAVVREIMLSTDGRLTATGDLYDIVSRPLGGGIYRLTLALPCLLSRGERAILERQLASARLREAVRAELAKEAQ